MADEREERRARAGPTDVKSSILSFLPCRSLARFSEVSRGRPSRLVGTTDHLWNPILKAHFDDVYRPLPVPAPLDIQRSTRFSTRHERTPLALVQTLSPARKFRALALARCTVCLSSLLAT